MPLYDYRCPDCGSEVEFYTYNLDRVVLCECKARMECKFPLIAYYKVKGEGGYPSRRKQIQNTTYRIHPPLEHDPKPIHFT